ncbi:MAG: hypothetical protein V3S51_03125 [Dehalococcoidia bacterium]
MAETRYEIVEEDKEARDELLSEIMPRHLLEGIAYFCMVESGEPMSPADMTDFLGVSDSWYTERFSEAVRKLIGKGLIREVA